MRKYESMTLNKNRANYKTTIKITDKNNNKKNMWHLRD